jgi:hypothetical protein
MEQSNNKDQPAQEGEGGEEQKEGEAAAPADPPVDNVDDVGSEKAAGDVKPFGQRIIREQTIQYDFMFLCEDIRKVVPEPDWPDPDKEPLPPPLINSI